MRIRHKYTYSSSYYQVLYGINFQKGVNIVFILICFCPEKRPYVIWAECEITYINILYIYDFSLNIMRVQTSHIQLRSLSPQGIHLKISPFTPLRFDHPKMWVPLLQMVSKLVVPKYKKKLNDQKLKKQTSQLGDLEK